MFYRLAKEPINAAEVSDPQARKSVFREMGRDVADRIRSRSATDAPGEIARLMEKAYKAGIEAAAAHEVGSVRPARPSRMTDLDIPSRTRQQIHLLRHALGVGTRGSGERDVRVEGMAMFMRPKVPGMPDTVSKDEWLFLFAGERTSLGKLTVSPLMKLGLYVDRELERGWKLAVLTEWGFELLVTGSTSRPENRVKGGSSTYERFMTLMEMGPASKAGRAMGLIRDEPTAPPGP